MNTKRLDLNLLVTLEARLGGQTVPRAASRLHLSQPAVSAQLGRLRDMFDDPLRVPAQRGRTPTAKALDLLEPLRQALDHVRAAVAQHGNFDPARARLTVNIACTDYLQVALAQPLILALRDRAPGVRVALRSLDILQLETQLARGEVDLALTTPGAAAPGLRARHLFDERRVVLSAASFLFLPQIVAQSDFVALVPQQLVRDRAGELKIVECPFPVPGFDVGMVWHERNQGHQGQRWVREALVELVAGRLGTRGRRPLAVQR